MLVSFLVPVYNVEKYLKECIESLLIQKGSEFEIILLNDGSTDQSGMICDEYAEKYPAIIRVVHKENEGPLLTRRRGFEEAKGDWIICIDSDDYVEEKLLNRIVMAIQEHECDMVMYNYQYVDEEGHITPSKIKLKDGTVYTDINKKELYLTRLFTTDINSMCTRAIRKDLIDIGVDYSNCGVRRMCDDAVQVLTLYTKTKKTIYIDETLYYYRKNHTSITSEVSWETWREKNKSFVISEQYLDIWNIDEKNRKKFYTNQMELICNCTRWIISTEGKDISVVKRFIEQLKEEARFSECQQYFEKKYCSTKYMMFRVPIVIRLLKKEKINVLKRIFLLEDKLRGK